MIIKTPFDIPIILEYTIEPNRRRGGISLEMNAIPETNEDYNNECVIATLTMTIDKNGVMMLNAFYKYITIRGFGKYMLCHALQIMSKLYEEKYGSDGQILLEASGGKCDDIAPFEPLSVDDMLRTLALSHSESDMEDIMRMDQRRLQQFLCDIEANIKLVNYYESLGFRVVGEENTLAVTMSGKISDVIRNACNENYS